MSLPPKARREVAVWIVQREFGEAEDTDDSSSSVQAALEKGRASGEVSTAHSGQGSPGLKILATILVLLLIGAGYLLWKKQESAPAPASASQEEILREKFEREEAAKEAARPRSPTNLDYLNERVGQEVTLRGIPKKAEVGFLYFDPDPAMGVRINLISGGVVVFQSTDLEKWVETEQELEVRGTLQRNEEGLLEIPIDRQIQIKLVGEVPEEAKPAPSDPVAE